MPKRYFLSVAMFGLCVIAGILVYYIGYEVRKLLTFHYGLTETIRIMIPILIGGFATIFMGMYFDKKVKTPNVFAVIFLIPYTIYLAGIGTGCLCGFLMYGLSPFDPWSFLGKPLIYGLIGTPGALGVGVISYLFFILVSKISARN